MDCVTYFQHRPMKIRLFESLNLFIIYFLDVRDCSVSSHLGDEYTSWMCYCRTF